MSLLGPVLGHTSAGRGPVLLDAGLAEIGHAPLQLGEVLLAALGDQLQPAVQHRHHAIVVFVAVPAGRGAGGKTPFGDAGALIVDEDGCDGLVHGFDPSGQG